MEQARNPFQQLDEIFERVNKAIQEIPPDKLLLRDEEIRIDLPNNSYVILRAPLGDVLAKYTDMFTQGKPFSEVSYFLIQSCVKEYKIVSGNDVLDSSRIKENKRAETLWRRASPTLITYIVLSILRYMRQNQLAGMEALVETPESDEGEKKEDNIQEIPVE